MEKKQVSKPSTSQKRPKAGSLDWERIELHYRAGIRSLKDIGSEFGVSDAGIIKRAKRDGWERDLRAKIQAKAEAKVSASLVSAEVSALTKASERQIVEVNAQAVADVRLSQRGHIDRALKLAMALFQELEQQTDPETLELLKDLGDFLRDENERGEDKRNDLFRRVMSLPERSKTMKQLADTLKVLVDMQRIAYGMDVKGAEQTPGATGFVPPAIRIVHVAAAPVQQEDLTDE